MAQHRHRRPLPAADRQKFVQPRPVDRQHVALLGLVAPELQRGHPRLVAGDLPQLEGGSPPALVDQLRQRVRQPPRPDVVNRQDRRRFPQGAAPVDDLLAAPLHLRVVPLHRGEIQLLAGGPGGHRRGRSSPQPDAQRRTAQHQHRRPRRDLPLVHVRRPHVPYPPRDHDRLVIAPHLPASWLLDLHLKGPEEPAQVGAPELVVEGGAAEGPLDHDVKRGSQAGGAGGRGLPGTRKPGEVEVGDSEAGEPGLGPRAPPGGALVADLTPGPGGGPREGSNGRRVVVGLDLEQHMSRLGVGTVDAIRVREEARRGEPLENRSVVPVSREDAPGAGLGAPADHLEERQRLLDPVEEVARVEDLVAAVLAVGLGEHHQLDVRRVPPEGGEVLGQVVDLIVRERQPQGAVGLDQGASPSLPEGYCPQGPGARVLEQRRRLLDGCQERLGHPVMERRGQGVPVVEIANYGPGDPSLDAAHPAEAADPGDVRRLRGPGRDRPQARDSPEAPPFGCRRRGLPVVEERGQRVLTGGRRVTIHEMNEGRGERRDSRVPVPDPGQPAGETRGGEDRWAWQDQHGPCP